MHAMEWLRNFFGRAWHLETDPDRTQAEPPTHFTILEEPATVPLVDGEQRGWFR